MPLTLRGASYILVADLAEEEEILLVGPAGTSKTVAGCRWLIEGCARWPGSQHLICRDERSAMTDTTLVTMDSVIEDLLGTGCHEVQRVNREQRHSYRIFGSEIVVAGLDDPAKCFGSAYGRIVVEEAIQVSLESWELFGRAARDPKIRPEGYMSIPSQRLAVTNPGDPEHWLNRRATREPESKAIVTRDDWKRLDAYNRGPQEGVMRRLVSVHQDNPAFFNMAAWDWTVAGRKYLASLAKMSGHRRARMLAGDWVSGVGDPVFDEEGVAWMEEQMKRVNKERPIMVRAGRIMAREADNSPES